MSRHIDAKNLAGALIARADRPLSEARAFEKHARSVVQPLAGKFAWRTLAHFAGVLTGIAMVAALAVSGHLSYWAAVPANAILIYFMFAPLHEATHDNIAGPNPDFAWLTGLIGHVSGFVLFAPYVGFRPLHLHHHNHTNEPAEDPDYWVKTNNYIMLILRCMVIQPVYVLHLYKIARDPMLMRAFVWDMLCGVLYGLIIAGAYAFGFGNKLMLLWFLPGHIAIVMCPLMFDWLVHHPHTERGRYADSAILLFPWPIRRLMDLFLQGHAYHLIHHMYPRVPYYHYGTAYYALESELAGVGVRVRRPFNAGFGTA